ncbi:MAG: hypothetical protein ACYCPQ_08550 [Elusimicrobiota bacterium]
MKASRALLILAGAWVFFGCARPKKSRPAALFPKARIVTYYGNPLSRQMGVLGQMPPKMMMDYLAREAQAWQEADPSSIVRPGLELVAVVASNRPGEDGLYRVRMPRALIARVVGWARGRGWLTILDVQVGHSTVGSEIGYLRPFLEESDVHLAIDPEFQMPGHLKPGERIGGSDAEDVNVAVIALAKIVSAYHLPPKVLLVHRFTDHMLRRRARIRLDPRVQVVVVMDGFGSPGLKTAIYRREITRAPVQYAGIKLFYKNDQPLMGPRQVLALSPVPRVIIYQ